MITIRRRFSADLVSCAFPPMRCSRRYQTGTEIMISIAMAVIRQSAACSDGDRLQHHEHGAISEGKWSATPPSLACSSSARRFPPSQQCAAVQDSNDGKGRPVSLEQGTPQLTGRLTLVQVAAEGSDGSGRWTR